ncbi:MAG: hypothetical protein ABIC19_02865 [Patescibacteria group bacterium]|nr:hypothetical protein [Patescibacteria group bacterium]
MFKKIKNFRSLYFVVIFALSFAVGYYAKSIAKNYLTMGFDDAKIKALTSDYNLEEVSKKVQEIQAKNQQELENSPQDYNNVQVPVADEAPAENINSPESQ